MPPLTTPNSSSPPSSGTRDSCGALEQALTRLLRRAFLPTSGEDVRRDAGVDLERATYGALVRTAELGAGRLKDIADRLGLDLSTTSRHLKRLVDTGYVAVSPCPDDARARRYRLTAAGSDALERVRQARCLRLAELLHDWDDTEIEQLAAGIDRFLHILDTDNREPS